LKSRKALSPVVAAIILIAVTVAVSIAVAAWMGALTFTFMKTEELKVTYADFGTADEVTLTVQNTGTSKVTVSEIWVNGVKSWGETEDPVTIDPGATDSTSFVISYSWEAGKKYEFELRTPTANKFFYTCIAPL